MTIQTPAGLFLLAAVPLAAYLLLRRLRRRERPVAAYFLLQDLIDSLPALSRSHLLRRKLQALLFLAALACAGLAAGGPVLGQADDPPQRAVILVDTLLPGKNPADRAAAWERLADAVAALVRPLRSDDRVAIVRADEGIVGGGLLTPREAARLVRSGRPTMIPADPGAALDLAALAERAHGPATVAIVTHTPERWQSLLAGRGSWRIVPVTYPAAGGANRAILGVEVRPDFLRPGRIALFCRTGVFGQAEEPAGESTLTVSIDGRVLERRAFTVAPGQPHGEVFTALDAGPGLLRVEIAPADAFPADNTFVAPLRAGEPVPVLLVAAANRPVEAALRAMPGVRLTVVPPFTGAPEPPAAVRVYDNCAPREASGNILVIAPPEGLPGVGYRGDAPAPRVVRADQTHFLLTGVNLESLRPRRLPIYELPSGLDVLASADGNPLVAAGRTAQGARIALVAFDPVETGWSHNAAFPILVANLVAWLAESPEGARSSFLVGDSLPEALARGVRSVHDPAGAAVRKPRGGWGAFRFTEAGRWRLEGRTRTATGEVFVNVLDERVSAAMAIPSAGAAPGPARDAPRRPFRAPVQTPLLIAAIALLLLEQFVAPKARAGRLP